MSFHVPDYFTPVTVLVYCVWTFYNLVCSYYYYSTCFGWSNRQNWGCNSKDISIWSIVSNRGRYSVLCWINLTLFTCSHTIFTFLWILLPVQQKRIAELFETNTYSVVNIFDATLRPQLNVTGVVEVNWIHAWILYKFRPRVSGYAPRNTRRLTIADLFLDIFCLCTF